jgi:hypothetical protein
MAGRSPAEAVNAYVESLKRAVSCVTRGVLNVGGYHATDDPLLLALGPGRQELTRGFGLTLLQRYVVVEAEGDRGPWKCSSTAYEYALDDPDGREIIAYHWHPAARSWEAHPHAHLGPGAQIAHPGLVKAHLPTNRISAEDFLTK